MLTLERRKFWLSGAETKPWLSWRRVAVIVVLGAVAAICLFAIVITQSLMLVIVLLVTIGAAVVTWRRKNADGAGLLGTWLGGLSRAAAARWGRWDEFDPDIDDRPFWLEGMRVFAVSGANEEGELALLEDRGHLVAILEVDGGGEGIASIAAERRREDDFRDVLRACARARTTVSQLDLFTRRVPAEAAQVKALQESDLDDWVTPTVKRSMLELGELAGEEANAYRSWVAVRMPILDLAEKARDLGVEPSEEVIAESAFDTVAWVTRLFEQHGIPVFGGLSPKQAGAVIRGILLPDYSVDDTDGITDFWECWPAFEPAPRGDSLAVFAPDAMEAGWFHAAGSIPRRGWPDSVVNGRWLTPLIVGGRCAQQVVVTSLSLMPPHRALALALDQLTTASARRLHKDRTREVSTGEEQLEESSARTVGMDITLRSQAGVRVVSRVMVSARSRRQLRQAREDCQSIMEQQLGVTEFWWDDARQTVGVMSCLPLGWEVAQ